MLYLSVSKIPCGMPSKNHKRSCKMPIFCNSSLFQHLKFAKKELFLVFSRDIKSIMKQNIIFNIYQYL